MTAPAPDSNPRRICARLLSAFGIFLAAAAFPGAMPGARAADADEAALAGAFNTGPSLEKDAAGASLNIRFHPCADDAAAYCATIVDVIEPAGPSGKTILPNGDPVIGFVFIRDLEPKGAGRFRGGKIAAVDESLIKNKMVWYGVKIDANADGSLAATGCLGVICPRKMRWTPVDDGEENEESAGLAR